MPSIFSTFVLFISFCLGKAVAQETHQSQINQTPQAQSNPIETDIESRKKELTHADCAWPWQQMQIENAFQILAAKGKMRPGAGITLAHLDTGVLPFSQLQRNASKGGVDFDFVWRRSLKSFSNLVNFVEPHLPAIDNEPRSPNFGHGTETAALVAGGQQHTPIDGWTFAGLSPWSRILPVKVTDSVVMVGNVSTGGTADLKNLAAGIKLAIALKVDVITISLGALFDPMNLIRDAIAEALHRGIIVVAAAGQVLPLDIIPLPARLPGVVSVTASTEQRTHWKSAFSSRLISIAAPGENICHLAPEPVGDRGTVNVPEGELVEIRTRGGSQQKFRTQFRQSSGTSYSTAFTAGAAALWLQLHNPNRLARLYGQKNISRLFQKVVQNFGVDTPQGWNVVKHGSGILNIRKLLEAPLPCQETDLPENCQVKLEDFLRTTSG